MDIHFLLLQAMCPHNISCCCRSVTKVEGEDKTHNHTAEGDLSLVRAYLPSCCCHCTRLSGPVEALRTQSSLLGHRHLGSSVIWLQGCWGAPGSSCLNSATIPQNKKQIHRVVFCNVQCKRGGRKNQNRRRCKFLQK